MKYKWIRNEMARLKQMKHHITSFHKSLSPKEWKEAQKGTKRAPFKPNESANNSGTPKKGKGRYRCHFCKKTGHYHKDCHKRKAWFKKKGIHLTSACFKSNLNEVPSNTWWLDSCATGHVFDTIARIPCNPEHKSR